MPPVVVDPLDSSPVSSSSRSKSVHALWARIADGTALPSWLGQPGNRIYYAGLILILIVSAILRFINLDGDPSGFFCDEAAVGYNAYTIGHFGTDEYGIRFPLVFRSFDDYKSPVFIYLQVPGILLFGMHVATVRGLSALLGVLGVLVIFVLCRQLFASMGLALVAAFLLAISPWHIHWSRVGFDLGIVPFFALISLSLFLVSLKRPRLLPASFALWGISIYTYQVAKLLFPLLLLACVLIYWRDVWRYRSYVVWGVVAYLIILSPLVHDLLNGTAQARFGLVSVFSEHLPLATTIGTLARQYIDHFSISFLFQLGSEPGFPIQRHTIDGMGLLYWFQLPLVIVGIVGMLIRHRRSDLIVLAALLVYPIGGALTVDGASSSRSDLGDVIFQIVSAYGLIDLWRGWTLLRRLIRLPSISSLAPLVAASAVVIISFNIFVGLYYTNYPRYSGGFWGWQQGPEQIIAYFKTIHTKYDQLFMTGSFNAPYIFYDFFDPNHICSNCTIGGLNNYNPNLRQVFALRPEEMSAAFQYRVLKKLYYGDGTVAYYIVQASRTSVFSAQSGSSPSVAMPGTLGGGVQVLHAWGASLLRQPRSAIMLPGSEMAVADTGNGSLDLLSPRGTLLKRVTEGDLNGNPHTSLMQPFAVERTPDGLVALLDAGLGRIEEYRPDGTFVRAFGAPGQASSARDMAIAADGHIFLANPAANSVVEFSPSGSVVSTYSTAIGNGPGQLNQPSGIAVGPDNLIYVLDNGNQRVQALDRNYVFHGQWAAPASVTIFSVRPLVIGPPGKRWLLLSDPDEKAIVAYPIDRSKGTTTTAQRFILQDLTDPTGAVVLSQPAGLAAGPNGSLLLTDSGSNVIWQLRLAGID